LRGGAGERSKHALLIEKKLNENDGFLPVHDKSDPAKISEAFGISKGAFKKAVGILYKQKVITIEKDGIRLVKS
jgi:predicted RNA-binding protein (virulence factor B family)